MTKILFVSSSIKSKYNPFLDAFKKSSSNLDIVYFPDHELQFIDKIKFNLLLHSSIKIYNKSILKILSKGEKYDLVVVVKGTYIDLKSYQLLRSHSKKMIYWSNDDISRKHNNSYYLRKSLRLFDRVYSMKILNLLKNELRKFKVKDVEYLLQCYSNDMEIDLLQKPRKSFIHEVTFIGSYEDERFRTIKFLAANGVDVNIYGNGWDNQKNKNLENIYFHEAVTGIDYQKTINESKISLCFLRKVNEDSVTVRSVEIPAYGGFMIGEYSVEHSYIMNHKTEAIWCKTDDDFLKYVKYFINNPIEREEIAIRGNQKVKTLNCSYEVQVRYIKECFIS
jgi:spore maturation protein CgeB